MRKRKYFIFFTASLLILLHIILSSLAIFAKSPTFDESVHLTGGYTYWKLNDFRINPENGNFPQRLAAIPLLFDKSIILPLESTYWQNVQEWFFSFFFLFKSGNNPDNLFIPAKFMMLFLSTTLCLSVFYVSSRIFNSSFALISLFFCVFSPTVLAHSNLITSDISASLFFLLSVYFIWENLKNINIANTLLSSLSLSLLFLSKMSAPIIIPFYLICIFIRLISDKPLICEFRKKIFIQKSLSKKILTLSSIVLIQLFFVYFSIWAAFSFRYSQVPPGSKSSAAAEIQFDDLIKGKKDFIDKSMLLIDKLKLLPRAYTHGYLYVKKHLNKRISFMNGEKSNSGFLLFFPYAFMIKTPLPLILLLLLSTLYALKKSIPYDFVPFAIFAILFIIFALSSGINIGHRHLLPLYPIFFIFCPYFAYKKSVFWKKAFLVASSLFFAFDTLIIMPDYLAYFNQIAGGPKNAYKKLVDSSLDWGQDLKELKNLSDFIAEEKNFYLSYFGTASINSYGLQKFISLPGYFTQENFYIHNFKPGVYCISATMLYLLYYQDIFATLKFPPEILFNDSFEKLKPFIDDMLVEAERGNLKIFLEKYGEDFCLRRYKAYDLIRFAKLCEYLKQKKPDYYAGYSILVYKLNENDINNAMKMKVSF
ncbi:MAG TPA: hypothetical protein P5105_01485 [Victivallales bacterium]|nr:hypothetical protein [Victivallales bacterium]HPO91047.1 hypothetical protein [Victivallales bacterium]HRR05927.1 hypothetical protein [Victivallales bacterium]HRU01078.1 hypothetical protein [Victivallales bacterium]